MTKKSTFRKPATDAVIEYLQQHKTATFAELIAALPQYEKYTIQVTREALRKRNQIVRVRDGNNLLKLVLDYLVSENVLEDDNMNIVVGEQWINRGIDVKNPRIEITIKEFKNEI